MLQPSGQPPTTCMPTRTQEAKQTPSLFALQLNKLYWTRATKPGTKPVLMFDHPPIVFVSVQVAPGVLVLCPVLCPVKLPFVPEETNHLSFVLGLVVAVGVGGPWQYHCCCAMFLGELLRWVRCLHLLHRWKIWLL